jgi:VanZ family protein
MTGSPRWRLAAAIWAAAIVVLGVVPIGPMVQAIGPPDPVTTTGHFVAYAGLGFILVIALGDWRVSARLLALALALAVALGVVVELIQGPIPYRDASLLDLAVDVAGAAVGLAVFSAVAWGRRSRSHPG